MLNNLLLIVILVTCSYVLNGDKRFIQVFCCLLLRLGCFYNLFFIHENNNIVSQCRMSDIGADVL